MIKKSIILGLGVASACFAAGSQEINKTFIKPSEPVAMMLGDRLLSCRSRNDEVQKGLLTVDVTTFYRSSIESGKLAKALGYNGRGEIGVFDLPDEPINPGEFIYTYQPMNVGLKPDVSGLIHLYPKEQVCGAIVQLYRQLGNSWYIGGQLPLVYVRRDIGRKITGGTEDVGLGASLERYLDGRFEQNTAERVQEKLQFSKITGKAQSTYGLSDCTFYLGAMLVDNDDAKMTAWAEILASSKDRGNGKHLFEPVLGNGGFHALGAGLVGQITIDEVFGRISGFRFYCKGRVFEQDKQVRTLGLRLNGPVLASHVINEDSIDGVGELDPYYARPWGHLILGGQTGKAGFFPLANQLTRQIDIRPGPQLDLGSSFFMESKMADINICYGLTLQQAERIEWKPPFFGDAEIGYNATGIRYYPGNVPLNDWNNPPFPSQPRKVIPEITACQVPHTILHQLSIHTNFYLLDKSKQFFCSATYQWSENRVMASAWECMVGLKIELF